MVAIKDMEMPDCCGTCELESCVNNHWYCSKNDEEIEDRFHRLANCPLIEIEQSSDCVSRTDVKAVISQHHFDRDKGNFDLLIHNLVKEVEDLPPVTPTIQAISLERIKQFREEIQMPKVKVLMNNGMFQVPTDIKNVVEKLDKLIAESEE